MDRVITRAKYLFLAVFAVVCVGLWTYQIMYVLPRERCERSGRWWTDRWRACADPIDLSRITGRPNRPQPAGGTPAR